MKLKCTLVDHCDVGNIGTYVSVRWRTGHPTDTNACVDSGIDATNLLVIGHANMTKYTASNPISCVVYKYAFHKLEIHYK